MSLSDMIKRWSGRKSGTAGQGETDKPVEPFVEEAADSSPVEPAKGEDKSVESLDKAIELFKSMQDIIGSDTAVIKVPCRAVLAGLPEDLRGREWRASSIPDVFLELEAEPLLKKLQTGRAAYDSAELEMLLPEGWMTSIPGREIELSLQDVVSAIPEELLQADAKDSSMMQDLAGMRDYFRPAKRIEEPVGKAPIEKETVAEQAPSDGEPITTADEVERKDTDIPRRPIPVSSEPTVEPVAPVREPEPVAPMKKPEPVAPVREPEPVAPMREPEPATLKARRLPRPLLKPAGSKVSDEEWDGVERTSGGDAFTVDVNTASAQELLNLPGVGETTAKHILGYRNRLGRIDGIYDLLCIPGIGADTFAKMTGLDPSRREDRSIRLNHLLNRRDREMLKVSQLADIIQSCLGAQGCVLASQDGMVLSRSANLSFHDAAALGAHGPQLFRRSRRCLELITGAESQTVILPLIDQPLLLMTGGAFILSVILKKGGDWLSVSRKGHEIVVEMDWLLSPRAIVAKE